MSIEDYYNTLVGLYDELSRLKALHHCTCGDCSCDIATKFAEKFHQFLVGVDDELYSTVRSNLLSRVPVPSLDEAYQVFTQDEKSRGIARNKVDKVDVQRPGLIVQPGHDNSTCFKLHGYPDWWEERNLHNRTRILMIDKKIFMIFPNVQLVYLMGTQRSPLNRVDCRVSLVGGLTLFRILFVPNLNCNLLSVSQLIDDVKCHVYFTDSLCAIQDQRSGNLIGAGEQHEGLYYFRGIPKVCAMTVPSISDFELWHHRLGPWASFR
ncbi:hypothetical protein LIER_09793 [Lithospermum erythrorhizon]|uniref:Uncharacterized protein n=1 Tax=Lithospermum erythrorhizon TaxID=34254 RepID=A0AAV3PIN7_LITER